MPSNRTALKLTISALLAAAGIIASCAGMEPSKPLSQGDADNRGTDPNASNDDAQRRIDQMREAVANNNQQHPNRTGNADFAASGEIGLMGLAVDPAFTQNRRIYTCQGSSAAGTSTIKVVAWSIAVGFASATRVVDPLVGGIPMGSIHGGCRLEFAPDGTLLVTTGDAAIGTAPQSLGSLAGKVLRVDPATGAGAPDNVFAADGDPATDARIYTRGHRNVQGLAIRPGLGQFWSVEHGPNRDDEVNLLENGGNYGWDPVPGYDQSVPMTDLSLPGAVGARSRASRPITSSN